MMPEFGSTSSKPGNEPGESSVGAKNPAENWTFAFGRIGGLKLRIHVAFVIGIALFFLLRLDAGSGDIALAVTITSFSLFLHEIGHALMARRFGAQVLYVVLYPLRATAFCQSGALKSREKLKVAFAGPAANAAAAFIAWAVIAMYGAPTFSAVALRAIPLSDLMMRVTFINALLAAVNLLPALPFDGGRALLILLLEHLDRIKAVAIAIQISLIVSCGIGVLALAAHVPLLSLLGVFIALGATREARLIGRQEIDLDGQSARKMIADNSIALTSGVTLSQAAPRVEGCRQRMFPVFQGQELVGLVSRSAMARGLARRGDNPYIAEIMIRKFETVRAEASAKEALTILSRSPTGIVVVLDGDDYVGTVTTESARSFLAARAAAQDLVERQAAAASPIVSSAASRRDHA